MQAAISVENLSYAYPDGTRVLSALCFAVAAGSFFIIIGPNGSGKTTLIKTAAGLLRPDRGRIDVLGRPLASYSRRAVARRIAYVSQQTSVDFPFRVTDAVLLGRAPHLGTFGIESARDRKLAEQAMAFTEVEHLAGRRMDQLSGGERQRVLIARAICQEPEIILLDEPTAALDIAHQLRMMDLMEKMKREKEMTVLMVSHDINLAAMYADQLMLIHKGGLVKCGSPGEVISYDTLENVYGCRLLVDENPLGGMVRVTPVPGRYILS